MLENPVQEAGVPEGVSLLLPHLPAVLRHIHTTIAKPANFSRGGKGPLLELHNLSTLSHHAPPGGLWEDIAVLLFTIVGKKFKAGAGLYDTVLGTLKALLARVNDVTQFCQPVAELFSSLTSRASHNLLSKVFAGMAGQDARLEAEAHVATKLNVWDRRHVEEPDYLLRLEGFEERESGYVGGGEGGARLQVLLLHNCVYTLTKINDMALKDAARWCVENIITLVYDTENNSEMYKQIIVKNLLGQVKKNIGSFDENARNEFLHLLGYLVQKFPHSAEFSTFTSC